MKEYGGYFELEPFTGLEYHHEGVMRFNYCRTALQYLLSAKKIRKIYLPYFICDSVINAVEQMNIAIEYYPIDERFLPRFSAKVQEDELLLIVNYYGLLTDQQIDTLIARFGRVVVDNTQAFFSRPPANAPAVYSCRKFFGVPDGGYLAADVDGSLPEGDRSEERLSFLVGRLEDSASDHYTQYREAEEQAERESIKTMSRFTRRILCGIDYDKVIGIRKQNYAQLHKLLGDVNVFPFPREPEVPFMYPLMLAQNAAEVRRYLNSQKVYVPVLWGNVLDMVSEDSLEAQFVKNVLPLPIDQRYNENDMQEIAAIVKRGIAQC